MSLTLTRCDIVQDTDRPKPRLDGQVMSSVCLFFQNVPEVCRAALNGHTIVSKTLSPTFTIVNASFPACCLTDDDAKGTGARGARAAAVD